MEVEVALNRKPGATSKHDGKQSDKDLELIFRNLIKYQPRKRQAAGMQHLILWVVDRPIFYHFCNDTKAGHNNSSKLIFSSFQSNNCIIIHFGGQKVLLLVKLYNELDFDVLSRCVFLSGRASINFIFMCQQKNPNDLY